MRLFRVNLLVNPPAHLWGTLHLSQPAGCLGSRLLLRVAGRQPLWRRLARLLLSRAVATTGPRLLL